MSEISRRRFLEDTLLAAAAAAAVPATAIAAPRRGPAAADPLRIAVIGVRGRGRAHIKAFNDSPDAKVVAICDPDEGVIGPAARAARGAKYVKDMRRLLEDDSIDAVSIATPNHWHSLATGWALEAGKHVYVEKPVSHSFSEGRDVVDLAERTGLVVQHGTQARSHRATRDAMAWLNSGGLGKVRLARGLCYKRRKSIGKVTADQAPPATLDYDLWTGPAELRPLRRKNLHYDWHWDFNTGNGDLGNQGVHQMDIARWGLGQDGFPRSVVSLGGRLGYDDDGDTPNTQIAVYDYGEQQLIFEVRGLATDPYKTAHVGVVFHCDDGYLVSASYGKVVAFDRAGKEVKVFTGGGNHFQNWIDAVRAGDPSLLNSGVREGHVSAGMCHLGNTSYRMASARRLDASDKPFGDHEAGNESFQRMRRHLADRGVAPAKTEYRVGPLLSFDPVREIFVGERAAEAGARLVRANRKGYSFPAQRAGAASK